MVAELSKSIKPKKLKVDQVRLRILNELRKEGRRATKEFEKTTATWKGEKPTFKSLIGLTTEAATVVVGPGSSTKGAQKWVWLDEGTKPHPIVAKNAPNLVFRSGSGFTAKTSVGKFSSRAGTNTGSFLKKKRVNHPGIEARNWTGLYVKRRQKPFSENLIEAAKI